MRKTGLFVLIMCIAFLAFSCTNREPISKVNKVEGDLFKSGSDDSNYVELHRVKDNIWVHTTYKEYNGVRTPSNGVIAVTSKGLILVDTPWNNEQTRELLNLAKKIFNKDISFAVITHAHDDRIGGIDALVEKKVDVRSTALTIKEAEKYGYKKPQTELKFEEKISLGDTDIEVFYPGEGHTVDNITVWFPQHKVLFGGCMIKSLESKDIGNVKDVNVKQWPLSVKKVVERYPDAEAVIPGHGQWGSIELVEHTIELLKN